MCSPLCVSLRAFLCLFIPSGIEDQDSVCEKRNLNALDDYILCFRAAVANLSNLTDSQWSTYHQLVTAALGYGDKLVQFKLFKSKVIFDGMSR